MKKEILYSSPPTTISYQQRDDYFDQGYLVFPELLDTQEIDRLNIALQTVIDKSRSLTKSDKYFVLDKGHNKDNPRLSRAAYLDDQHEVFWELARNSVITEIAADILGPNLRFRETFANLKPAGGGAPVKWHQDVAFYPHTNFSTCQFLLALDTVETDQGPLLVIPGSHKGAIHSHHSESGEWLGEIPADRIQADLLNTLELTGPAGTLSVHHSCTVHGSNQNISAKDRPMIVVTYSAADAIPYTAAPYPSSHYYELVRGEQPLHAHHEDGLVPLPPDWSNGYTSIFEHQEED